MIPLLKPSVTDAEIEAVTEVLKSGWWGNGSVVETFEKELAELYGYKYCITVNSATSALHLACKVLGIGHGDEVIVPSLTFVSTGLAPLYCGASVVLADVNERDLCIDWNHVVKLITNKTKAIIPVDFAGYPAIEYNIPPTYPIIQDSAHSCGGHKYGDMICLSFHPVKNLATGDGGAILTNDPQIASRLKSLRWCGIDKSTWERSEKRYGWDYYITEVGYKYHWNDIMASIGLVQLRRIDELNAKRRMIAEKYIHELKGKVVLPPNHPKHTWHLFPIRVENRNSLIDTMLSNGISAGVHYKPIYYYPMFKGDCPVTEEQWRKIVSIPIFYDLTEKEQDFIIKIIKENV